jgi:hypothetical protein
VDRLKRIMTELNFSKDDAIDIMQLIVSRYDFTIEDIMFRFNCSNIDEATAIMKQIKPL